MTLLITGVAGFIRSNFVYYYLRKHPEKIIGLDNLTYAGNLDNLSKLTEKREEIHFHKRAISAIRNSLKVSSTNTILME